MLAPRDVEKLTNLGIVLDTLPAGPSSTGIGGRARTRVIDAILTLDSSSFPLAIAVLEPSGPESSHIPSIMGRDILSRYALFLEERTGRVLLLDPTEANALALR